MDNVTSNETDTLTHPSDSHTWDVTSAFLAVVQNCSTRDASRVYLPIETFTLLFGFPTNVALLWMLLRGKKSLSPSEVLSLNLGVLNVIFCLSLPVDMYMSSRVRGGPLLKVSDTVSILNVFGCPLLLTSMCVERYAAAAHAVFYMKVSGRWQSRAVCCGLVWTLTLTIAGVTYYHSFSKISLYLSFVVDVLFVVMVACLVGIMRVLCSKGLAGQSGSSVKNRALKNTMLIFFPSFVIYAPLLALGPYILRLSAGGQGDSEGQCDVLDVVHSFPSLGTCVGPVFYMSRAKQLLCWKNTSKPEPDTTEELK